ncbi:Trifunctional NAD biosynthesis/regulator protein NadR [compost metagenome]
MEENLKQLSKLGATPIIKIAIFGPESTGKTTLATQLSEYYKTVWVPEFARDYLQEKLDSGRGICDINDMLPIAYGQTKLENESAQIANKYLFCDTNLLVTKVFSELYYNFCDSLLDKAARAHQYDLFFLTDIDVPWEDDGLRDSPDGRETVFEVFKQSLIDNRKPFITISGDKETRLKKAIAIIEDLTIALQMGLSSLDFLQIHEYGIPLENIQKQIKFFQNGVSKNILVSPATLSKGILELSEIDFQKKATFYDSNKTNYKIKKFVPASGAATRMFKFLTVFLNEFDIEKESINAYINRKKESELAIFIIGLEKFPFFEAVDTKLRELFPDFESLPRDYKNYYFIRLLLGNDYFDFANKPKAVLPFHKYENHIATALEEHLFESAYYASSNKHSHLHFTISEAHQNQFENILDDIKGSIEKQSGTTINVSYSFQNKKTDSIAVNPDNTPFRNEKRELVFRPGGHGALIENLNDLDADIIFIKNIDNVIQNNVEKTALYKKGLAGVLIELQQQIFTYLQDIETHKTEQGNIDEIILFLKEKLNTRISDDFHAFSFENKISKLKEALNRPIRVCGMVKNEGEPGGGPFWVRDEKGSLSLQIVESSQVDLTNTHQRKILDTATHFNPVDLVCGIKNYKNQKFDLTQFVDHNSGFIVDKTILDKKIKAYELPGLWNGAMAKWLTVFVQVPLLTFNPVKTVNDLLKPAHQPQ